MKLLVGLEKVENVKLIRSLLKIPTEYDSLLVSQETKKNKIKLLRASINTEITLSRPWLLDLERLGDRYFDDSRKALLDKNFGFFEVYSLGCEQVDIIARYCYRCLPTQV